MMKLTRSAVETIRAHILESPLGPDELRRIHEMGNLFVASFRNEGDEEGEFQKDGWTYWLQYSRKIDGAMYHFYGGTPPVVEEEG